MLARWHHCNWWWGSIQQWVLWPLLETSCLLHDVTEQLNVANDSNIFLPLSDWRTEFFFLLLVFSFNIWQVVHGTLSSTIQNKYTRDGLVITFWEQVSHCNLKCSISFSISRKVISRTSRYKFHPNHPCPGAFRISVSLIQRCKREFWDNLFIAILKWKPERLGLW